MFQTLFNLIKNELDVTMLNSGFGLESRSMPYATFNPLSASVNTQYSNKELLLQYSLSFGVYSRNKANARSLLNTAIGILKDYSDSTISKIMVPYKGMMETKPEVYYASATFSIFRNFIKLNTYDNLTGEGTDLTAALFDLYKKAKLNYPIYFSDFALESARPPYIVLTSLEESNDEDRSCESIYTSDVELVTITESFTQADYIALKLVDLYHSAKFNCTDYNVEEFNLAHLIYREVFPQTWQTNLVFNFQHND